MEFTISYSQTQMQSAARFIWKNNPSVKNWPSKPESEMDVYNNIRQMAIRDAEKNYQLILEERKTGQDLSDKWITYTGTGGYYMTYELIADEPDNIQIGIEVSVDPAVGRRDTSYVTEVIDYEPETV